MILRKMDTAQKGYTTITDRIQWVDIAKGITIILVILGHTIVNFYVRSLIFSVHMPLFFVLSGYTFKVPVDWDGFKKIIIKSARRLIIPAYSIWIIRIILLYFVNGTKYSLKQYILSIIYSSGTSYQMGEIEIPAFGMMWFLVALFIGRILLGLICFLFRSNISRTIIFLVVCFAGILIGRIEYLPFSFDVSLVSLPFLGFGLFLKQHEVNTSSYALNLAALVVWIGGWAYLSSKNLGLELAARSYPYGAVCIVSAVAGSYIILVLSKAFSRISILCFDYLVSQLQLIGCESMLLFTIHAFDVVWYNYLQNFGSTIVIILVRLSIDLLIFYFMLFTRTRIRKWYIAERG